jgi:hypothetical protein
MTWDRQTDMTWDKQTDMIDAFLATCITLQQMVAYSHVSESVTKLRGQTVVGQMDESFVE